MYAAPPHHTISAYGYPQGMVPLNSSTTYSTRPNLPAMQQQQQQQLYHHQPFYMMPSSSSFGVVSGAHPMVGYATQGPITYVLVPAADFNFQGVPSTVAASEVRRGGAVVDAALQPSTPFAASTFPSPSSPSNAASLSSGPVNASVLSPSQRFASSASVPLPVNNVAVSPASSLTPPSSLTSTSAHEDIGVDRVTIRTLERLMDDDEIAAALQRTNPRLPPSAPAMVEAVVEPSLSKASTGSQRSDEDAVPLPEEPTNSTTGRKKLQSSYAKAAVQSANGNNKSKDTAKKPSTNGQPTTASTALKFSSSRQKKGNRVTQIPPPAPGDTEKGPRQLIVNYLAPEVDSAGLEHLFAPYGDIEVARIVTDTATGLSRGYGFVYYRHHADAETAIDEASGRVLLGRRIRVSYAVPQRAVSSMVDGAK